MANYREPQWLLPNEKNLAMPASDATVGSGLAEDRQSLYSMDFDGTNDRIILNGGSDVDLGTACTISFWMNGNASYNGFIFGQNGTNLGVVWATTTVFYFYVDGSFAPNFTNVPPLLTANNWHHVVITRDGTSVSVYVNGSFVETQTGSPFTASTKINQIGARGTLATINSPFEGKIDEVALFKRVLSTSEISTLASASAPANIMALNEKPYAYYPLGEQARLGSEWQFPNEVLQSQVFDFDATDYINVSPILPLQGLSSFSISSWVYWDGHGGGSDQWIFIHANAGNTKRIQLEIYGSDLYFQIIGTGGGYARVDMPQGRWVNLLCVFNSSEAAADRMIVYIDGERATNVAYSAPTMTTTDTDYTYSMIGARNDGYYFDGKMSNVATWNSDQSANITNIYNNGSPQSSYTTTPTAWYKLNATSNYAGLNPNFHNALDLEGTSKYVSTGLTTTAGAKSLSYWFKCSTASGYQAMFGSTNGVSDTTNSYLGAASSYWADESISFFTPTGGSGSTTQHIAIRNGHTAYQDGNWHHSVLVYTGSTKYWYIDGVSQTIDYRATYNTDPSLDINIANLGIGFAYGATLSGNLQMSNFAYFDQAISAEDVKYLYNGGTPQTNLSFEPTSWWKLDNLTTGIQDSGSASNNGTNNGATEVASNVAVDQWNFDNVSQAQTPNWSSALDFASADSDYVNLSNNSSLYPGTGDVSYSAWIKPSSTTGFKAIFGVQSLSTAEKGVSVQVYNGEIWVFVGVGVSGQWGVNTGGSTGGAGFITSGANLTLNKWHHIAFTFDRDGDGVLYVNGEVNRTAAANPNDYSSVDIVNNKDLYIGRGNGYFDGEISNAQIWNTVIPATGTDSVETLYNNGTPLTSAIASSNLKAWYKLNNTANWEADSSGNWQIPEANSAYPQSFDFDGSDDYVDLGNNASLYPGTSDMSYSAWINPYSTTGFGAIFGVQNSSTAEKGVSVQVYNGEIWVFVGVGVSGQWGVNTGGSTGGAGFITSGANLTLNKWHHIAFTFDRDGDGVLYVNGEVNRTAAANPNDYSSVDIVNNKDLYIGRGNGYFDGEISNAAIFHTVLDASAISTIYNTGQPETAISSSPIAWWKLDSTTITDSSGNGNTGTNNGATEIQTNVWTPRLNGESTTLPSTALVSSDLQFESPYSNFSLDFDGTSDYIDCTDISYFSGADRFSLSTWFKVDSTDDGLSNRDIISKGSTSAGTTSFFIRKGKNTNLNKINLSFDEGTINVPGTTQLQNGIWYHLVVVYKGYESNNADRAKIYINGVDDTGSYSNTIPTTLVSSTQPVRIGRWAGSATDFNGNIDETAVWNSALTQAQVSQVYNNGYPADLTSLSPISWWRLGEDAYFVSPNFTVPNQITGAPNGTSANMDQADLVADAPGSYASGVGSSLVVGDRVGDAPESTANSLSINMIPGNRVPYPPGYVPTQADNVYSMAFDGASDYFTTSNAFTSLTSFSISAWFKSDDTVTAAQAITSSRINAIGTSQGLDIYLGSNTLVARVYNNGATEVTTAFTDTTSWHHVAVTYNGTTLEMYLDGVSKGTATGVYTNSAADWLIGKWNGGANYFNGNIDEVAIFDYALSERQVKQDIYNGTTTGKTADLNNISNLTAPVAWYRMGD